MLFGIAIRLLLRLVSIVRLHIEPRFEIILLTHYSLLAFCD